MRFVWKHVPEEKVSAVLPLFPIPVKPAKNELLRRKSENGAILSYFENKTLYLDLAEAELAVEVERRLYGEFLCYLGVDEAGKGDLVGSLFVASFFCKEEAMPKVFEAISTVNTKKSNVMSVLNAYEMLKGIEGVSINVERIPPEELDSRNINELLEEAFLKLLQRERMECRACRVSVDDFGIQRKREFLKVHGHCEKEIVHKADDTFFEVRAASIAAKAEKLKEMEKIAEETNSSFWEVGTGAAADNRTREWIKKLPAGEYWFLRKKFLKKLR